MRENQRIGAIRVHYVSIDLQQRGFEVFQEDGLCSFDLVAHKDGTLLRVEVKGVNGGGQTPHGNVVGQTSYKLDCRRFDILAVVDKGSTVRYLRSLATKADTLTLSLTGEETHSNRTTLKNKIRAKLIMERCNDSKA